DKGPGAIFSFLTVKLRIIAPHLLLSMRAIFWKRLRKGASFPAGLLAESLLQGLRILQSSCAKRVFARFARVLRAAIFP
ncbi:hypothetical protein, partial [Faecalibaculum rodentium]|uniref:hypothetical protein n=1 Tax=Faecalibaculum rodentium TaxID=1702221 RepID=UPI00272A2800